MHQLLAIENNDAHIPACQFKGNRAANDAAAHDDDVICIHKIILAVNAGPTEAQQHKCKDNSRLHLVAQASACLVLNWGCAFHNIKNTKPEAHAPKI